MARRPRGRGDRRALDPAAAIEALAEHEVDYLIIGGLAVIAHGSQRLTRDLDIVIDPRVANCRRLIAALVELGAELKLKTAGRWRKLSPKADPNWIRSENRFFDTRVGGIDIWNRMEGVPSWKQARPRAIEIDAFGRKLLVLDKDTLIRSKLAAGRDQDLSDVAELAESE
ncbi:MAG: DUF6036 family nucleotidyltransferase [Solirubrobacterales bacterium]